MLNFHLYRAAAALVLSLAHICTISATEATFIPTTPENTRLANGSPLPEDLASIGWQWLSDEGNGGVFASIADADHSMLMTWVDGLEPGAVYEVFGYFWADGWGQDHPPTREHVAAQFGISLATLHTFDGPDQPTRGNVMSWQVTPDAIAGRAYGLSAAIEENESFKLTHHESRLIRARLGRLHACAGGRLPVFFSAYPYRRPSGPAWIDGVGVRKVEADGPLEEGWKHGTWLHLALRAGDNITLERELQRGANLNALDEDHVTPLFYAVASADLALMKRLLEKGADPNLKGQAVSPLSAAAMLSNPDAVELLLNANALIPDRVDPHIPKLHKLVHPGALHPVVCALHSGHTPILRRLLDRNPDLDVRELMHFDSIKLGNNKTLAPPDTRFLRNAIERENWEMAEFLLDRGFHDLSESSPTLADLVDCVMHGEPARPVLEKLLKLDVPTIRASFYHYIRIRELLGRRVHDAYLNANVLQPKDVPGAAIFTGNTDLLKRMLPQVAEQAPEYQEALLALAIYTRNREIIDILRQAFPAIEPLRWTPPAAHLVANEGVADEDLRIYLPRTTPRPLPTGEKSGRYVLAVIASPDAADPGIALTAIASATEEWQAVDRELLQNVMAEKHLDPLWRQGEQQLAPLGDLLRADAMAVVDQIKGQDQNLYSFEIVETATGLVVHREHILDQEFQPERDLQGLLKRAAEALDGAGENERREAVTLLSFTARGGLPGQGALAKLLHATVQRRIDEAPGWISLSRAQSSRLVEEQALAGENSIWGAAHMVEGSISPAAEGKIHVALRMETLGSDSSVVTDANATGDMADAGQIINQAWDRLFENAEEAPNRADVKHLDPAHAGKLAKEEAARLLKEAGWLMTARIAPRRTRELIEAAAALGADPNDLVRAHLDFLFRPIQTLSCRYFDNPASATGLHHHTFSMRALPVALDLSDRMAHELPKAQELLDQASFYLDRFGAELIDRPARRNHHGNEFMLTISALSYMRAAIYPDKLPASAKDDFIRFSADLDAFTKRYFDLLATREHHDISRASLLVGGTRWVLERNPELRSGIIRTAARINRIDELLPIDAMGKSHGGRQLAHDILATLTHDTSPKAVLFKADLRCYLAPATEAPQATREFLSAAMHALGNGWYQLSMSTQASRNMVNIHSLDRWFGRSYHGSSVLPTLVHAPRPAADALIRPSTYLHENQIIRDALPRPVHDRWNRLGNWLDHHDKTLQEAAARNDGQRMSSTLQSLKLQEMWYGHAYHDELAKRYGRLIEQEDTPPAESRSLTAGLVADFRQSTTQAAGSSFWHFRDSQNPDLLWVFHFPSKDATLTFTSPHSTNLHHSIDAWLLAVDCASHEVIQRINLGQAAYEAHGLTGGIVRSSPWKIAFDQNDTHIITNVQLAWGHNPSRGRPNYDLLTITIDKKSGAAQALPRELAINDHINKKTHATWVSVVGLGREFYFLNQEARVIFGRNRNIPVPGSKPIWRLDAEMNLTPLIETARRPALTPFDGLDHFPLELGIHQGKLLVFNGELHATFDPESNAWDVIKDHHTQFGYKMYHFAKRELNRTIGDICHVKATGGEAGWKIDFTKLAPDHIWCDHETHGGIPIPIEVRLPDDFLQQTQVTLMERVTTDEPAGRVTRTVPREIGLADFLQTNRPQIVVLNQTADSLILGLQIEPQFSWKRPARLGTYLPFLWKISKSDVLQALE